MHKLASFTALCVLLAHCVLPAQSTICWIDPSDDFHERMPLILKANSDEFIYPNKCGSKSLRLTFQDNVRAACPADSISVLGTDTNLAEAKLSCYGITLFGLTGTRYAAPFRQIRCNRIAEGQVRATNTPCVNGTISQLGFAVSSTSFVPIVQEMCINAETNRALWTHHKVVAGLTKGKKSALAGDWWIGDIWQDWFSKSTTTTTANPLVGNNLISAMLVPREDMFYRAQQDSVTRALINSVPMFESVRNGNWRSIEDIVRKLASTKKQCATLDVWTGRYDGNAVAMMMQGQRQARQAGTTTTTDAPITSSTTVSSTSSTAIPTTSSTTLTSTTSTTLSTTSSTSTTAATTSTSTVAPATTTTPRFVFKMVVDTIRNRGIVFVTLSDPTVTAITAAHQLCTPYARCSQLYSQFNIVGRGYTHCCTLDAFATVAMEIGLPTFQNVQPFNF